ncbi:hypothetical protein FOL47_006409 [Perkinsus chesapeaki]|uniref:Uncharacterized protein n=1 Tax=Perkinsus chesapeaki TaxID=330153 RepID=A0A7J6LS14_PERCH|nr:hypothetical protein FOL47_006409 [Perkinsus chesapeaki]
MAHVPRAGRCPVCRTPVVSRQNTDKVIQCPTGSGAASWLIALPLPSLTSRVAEAAQFWEVQRLTAYHRGIDLDERATARRDALISKLKGRVEEVRGEVYSAKAELDAGKAANLSLRRRLAETNTRERLASNQSDDEAFDFDLELA